MVADNTNATPDRLNYPLAPSADVHSLLGRIAFLEEQIAELRRASREEKVRKIAGAAQPAGAPQPASPDVRSVLERIAFLEQQEAEAIRRLREIESSRGFRLLLRYYRLADKPLAKRVMRPLRRLARHTVRLVRRLSATA
jgi:hypothetical protein